MSICRTCNGQKKVYMEVKETCVPCKGSGKIQISSTYSETCYRCAGNRYILTHKFVSCQTCHGIGAVNY